MADAVTVWNPFIITNDGLNLRQEAIATGKTVTFNYAKIGQGAPSDPASIPLMTDLVTPAHQVPVVRSESNGVTHFVGVRIDNITFTDPVLMREIGVFASIDDGPVILYGYTYATQGYDSIPAGSISHYVWAVGIDTVLSRAQNISFTYDGSNVYASYDDIDQLIQAFDEFKAQVQELSNGIHKQDVWDAVELSDAEVPGVGVRVHYRIVADAPNYKPYTPAPEPESEPVSAVLMVEGGGEVNGVAMLDDGNIFDMMVIK